MATCHVQNNSEEVMRILLVGNGIINENIDDASSAYDFVVQINKCKNSTKLLLEKTKYIFITNTGNPSEADSIKESLVEIYNSNLNPVNPIIFFSRNRKFNEKKINIMKTNSDDRYFMFETTSGADKYWGFPCKEVDEEFSTDHEILMLQHGMKPWEMPSTGIIAFHWLQREFGRSATIRIIGFSHEGWEGHPWEVERGLLQNFYHDTENLETSPATSEEIIESLKNDLEKMTKRSDLIINKLGTKLEILKNDRKMLHSRMKKLREEAETLLRRQKHHFEPELAAQLEHLNTLNEKVSKLEESEKSLSIENLALRKRLSEAEERNRISQETQLNLLKSIEIRQNIISGLKVRLGNTPEQRIARLFDKTFRKEH